MPAYEDICVRIRRVRTDLFRNIKGIHQSQNLFDDLADDGLDFSVAVAVTEAGVVKGPSPLIDRPFDYGSAITFPFGQPNWQATRFSDGGSYGVWYGAAVLETTIYETVYHWARFILASYPDEDSVIVGERRVCLVACDGLLLDLRDKEAIAPGLIDRNDYTFCQGLGAFLVRQHQNGLVVHSARCEGDNTAIFNRHVLSNPRVNCYLTYAFNPARGLVVEVERFSSAPARWTIDAAAMF